MKSDHKHIQGLLKESLTRIEHGDYDGALWRVVDAAGLIQRDCHEFACGTNTEPTGRGYYVGKKNYNI